MTRIPGVTTAAALSCALALLAIPATAGAQAKNFKLLYSFYKDVNDGAGPGGLMVDQNGNLYGTTAYGGGAKDAGTVFELPAEGAEQVLYTFTGGSDGGNPDSTPIEDSEGNLYGTSSAGGADGAGTVFKVTPGGTETVLHAFTGGNDGSTPYAGLVTDASGNMYGTASAGGADGHGTIFELAPDGTETTLWTFTGGSDGAAPAGALTFDSQGNLYGTANFGGIAGCYHDLGCGTVYKLAPNGTFSVVYSFCSQPECADGDFPQSRLVADEQGNFYGTTFSGGKGKCYIGLSCGVVFKLAPDGTETVLFSFDGKNGGNPQFGVLRDDQGNLYGTTSYGGLVGKECGRFGCGVAYEIPANGTEKTLHQFAGADGAQPAGDPIADPAGNIYATGYRGGAYDEGSIWKLRP
jgi:uncharacterized repeat protein (TIGR03803 family)